MRAPSGVRRTRSTTRSIASLVGTPVLLEVADERGAEVADRLLAAVHGHVLAEDVERLLADAERLPVGAPAAPSGTGERSGARGDGRVHLPRLDDLVRELLGLQLGPGEDRL